MEVSRWLPQIFEYESAGQVLIEVSQHPRKPLPSSRDLALLVVSECSCQRLTYEASTDEKESEGQRAAHDSDVEGESVVLEVKTWGEDVIKQAQAGKFAA